MLVSGLELDDVRVGNGLELLICVKAPLGTLIESLEVRYLGRPLEEVWEVQIKLGDEHAELGAPVADMVHSEHIVALELENAADAVTLNR